MSSNQDFARYLHLRRDFLCRTNAEIENKLSDDSMQLVRQLDDGNVPEEDPRLAEAFFHIDCVVRSTFRYTMLVGVCSFLEEAMKEMSRRIVTDYEDRLKQQQKKKKGNWLHHHVAILVNAGLDTSAIQLVIDTFHALITIRNSIVHAWGKVSRERRPEKLTACIDQIETADVSKDGYILLGDQVVPGALVASRQISNHILTTMLNARM